MSYSTWAVQWSGNQFPEYTWHYPQLIPANWSLAYVLIGSLNGGVPLEVFPKAIMPLFPALLLWNIVVIGVEKKEPGYFLGAVFSAYLLLDWVGNNLGQGWVDVPVTFFIFLSLSMLLILPQLLNQQVRWLVLMGCVMAGAAVTKQAGLYFLLLFPILVYWRVAGIIPTL